MAWGKAGSSTTPTTSNVSVTGISANDTLQSILHITTSGLYSAYNRYNDVNSGNLYHGRYETNGTTDQLFQGNQIFDMLDNSGGTNMAGGDLFNISHIVNLETEEKLVIGSSNIASGTGAGTAPKRNQYVAKFANTSDKITSIENFDPSKTVYTSDSNASALGSDMTPASAVTFPTNVQVGSRAEITDTRKMYYRMDSDYVTDKWFELGTLPYAGGRGVFAGGYTGSGIDSMDYITIATTGTVTDFGNLTSARYGIGSLANTLRGVFAGGQSGSTVMDFITPATPANATTFGTLNRTQSYGMMGGASETTGVFAGGESSMTTEITKITIDSGAVQNANFGNLTTARKQGANFSDGTTAFFAGGEESGAYGVTIDYITIANGGTATDFGDLNLGAASMGNGNISNGTVGMFSLGGGSSNYTTRVDKVTMGISGTSSSFGTLTVGRSACSQCSTETRAVFAGGKTASGTNYTNTIDYMSFTNGTANDFGDLSSASQAGAGVSDTGAVRP